MIQKIIEKSIRDYERSLARNSIENPKSVYSFINSKTTTKESIKALYIYEEISNDTQSVRKTTTDGAVIASKLNKYFISVFSKEDISNIPKVGEKFNVECPNPSFTETVVKIYIDKLNTHKTVGVDNVHPKVLTMCSLSLCKPLSLKQV
jgi:hypothetical protein